MTPADQLLVVRAQLGHRGAHDQLADRWYGELRAYARALELDDAAAADACQDAWIDALRGLPGLRDPAGFRAWLFAVLRRRIVDGRRTSSREAHKRSVFAIPEPTSASVNDSLDALDLERALEQLPRPERETVELVSLRGLTYEEAATVLGIPTGTVRSRLHRARTSLKAALEEQP